MGNSADEFYNNLIKGKNGISAITHFDTSDSKIKVAAPVTDFNPDDFFDKKEAKRMDRYCQFAVAAAQMAAGESGFKLSDYDEFRCGVIVGSGIGGMSTYEKEHSKFIDKGAGRVSAFFIPMMISNMASGMISIKFGFKGIKYCPVTACASATTHRRSLPAY